VSTHYSDTHYSEPIKFVRDTALALIAANPGISDREIALQVYGPGSVGTLVNGLCRELVEEGLTKRRLRPDYLLGNWPAENGSIAG
jgi:hypothetical protein